MRKVTEAIEILELETPAGWMQVYEGSAKNPTMPLFLILHGWVLPRQPSCDVSLGKKLSAEPESFLTDHLRISTSLTQNSALPPPCIELEASH